MIAAWMIYASAVTAFLCIGAVAVEKTARLVRRPGRWIVAAALVAAICVPIVSRGSTMSGAKSLGPETQAPMHSLAPVAAIFPDSRDLQVFNLPLVLLWISVSGVLVMLLVSTHSHIARKVGSYREEELCGAAVLRSPALGPAVVGWMKSSIVMPAWVDEVRSDWRDLMVRHEQEHVRSRDALVLSTAMLLVALLPWNVPLWCLLLRLRRAIELDCDQRVLKSGVDLRLYGNLLLEMSRRRTRTPLPMVGLAFTRSFLAQRVDAMTVHLSSYKYSKVLLAVVLGVAFVVIACKLPAPVEPPAAIAVVLQEASVDSIGNGGLVHLYPAVEDEVDITLQPTPEELRKIRMALNINAVLNSANIGRLPPDVVERLRDHKLLLKVREQDGKPCVSLRDVSEGSREVGSTGVVPSSLGQCG